MMHNSGAIASRDSEAVLHQRCHCERSEAIQNPAAAAVWIPNAGPNSQ